MTGGVSIEIKGWDKIVQKYGTSSGKTAVKHALTATTVYTADLVKTKLAGQHHVTGFLASSIVGQVTSDDTGKTFAKPGGTVYYASFVERGTGLFGPRHQRIRPVSKKAMSWHPKTATGAVVKGSGKISRRNVKGQKPVGMFHNTFLHDRDKIKTKFQTAFRSKFGMP